MIKILRYLLAVIIVLGATYVFRKNKSKLRILKTIPAVIVSLILVIMPFENLFLEFSSPEDAFRYAVNGTIIKTVEQENTALVIYQDSGDTKATIINRDGEKWKSTFLPTKQKLVCPELYDLSTLYEVVTNVLITYEGQSNNFYILVSPPYDAKISDNMGSVFETFSVSMLTHFVAYVEDSDENYTININEKEYPILKDYPKL